MAIRQTVSGELTAASATYGDGRRYALSTFLGSAGQRVQIDMTSTELDSYLILQDQNARQLASDDDGGGDNNSHINITLRYTGMYLPSVFDWNRDWGNDDELVGLWGVANLQANLTFYHPSSTNPAVHLQMERP